jgi:hypothetical protein
MLALFTRYSVQYDHLSTTIEDYAELAVGFGYNALFVAALPIAAFFYLSSACCRSRAMAGNCCTCTGGRCRAAARTSAHGTF